jgi:hypothetical protein
VEIGYLSTIYQKIMKFALAIAPALPVFPPSMAVKCEIRGIDE